jgi:hypothetical protein
VDLGEMMVTVGEGEWGKRWARSPCCHAAANQMASMAADSLQQLFDDEWVHERGRIEHKPYFIRQSIGAFL